MEPVSEVCRAFLEASSFFVVLCRFLAVVGDVAGELLDFLL